MQRLYTLHNKMIAYIMISLLMVNLLSGSINGCVIAGEAEPKEEAPIVFEGVEDYGIYPDMEKEITYKVVKDFGSVDYRYTVKENGKVIIGPSIDSMNSKSIFVKNSNGEMNTYEMIIEVISRQEWKVIYTQSITFRLGAAAPSCLLSADKECSNDRITVTYIADKDSRVETERYKAYRIVSFNGEEQEAVELTDMKEVEENRFCVGTEEIFEEEGNYMISYYLENAKGDVVSAPDTVSFVIDKTAPIASIAKKEIVKDGKTTVECMIVADEPCVVTVSGSQKTIKGDVTLPEQVITLTKEDQSEMITYAEDGIYDLKIIAIDTAWNVSEEAENAKVSFAIDNTAPAVSITGVEDDEHYGGTVTLKLLAEDLCIHDYFKDYLGDYKVIVKKDNEEGIEQGGLIWKSTGDYQAEAEIVLKDDADYVVTFTAKDAGGIESEAKKTFVIDNISPSIHIDKVSVSYSETGKGSPEEDTDENDNVIYYLSGAAKLNFTVFERYYETAKVFVETWKDKAALEQRNLIMKKAEDDFSVLYEGDGNYQVKMHAEDKVGNKCTPVERQFVIDTIAPTFEITGVDEGKAYKGGQMLTFQATDLNHKLDSYKITVKKTLKDGTEETGIEIINAAAWEGAGETVLRTLSFDEEGNYTVSIEGNDKAGNAGVKKTVNFRIDKTAPIITQESVLKNGAYYKSSVELKGSIEEFNFLDADITIKILRTVDGTQYEEASDVIKMTKKKQDFSYLLEKEGKYEIKVTAKDSAGNEAESLTLSFVMDKTAPKLLISGKSGDKDIFDGDQLTEDVRLTYQTTDRNHDFLQYSIYVVRTDLNGVEETWIVDSSDEKWLQEGYNIEEQKDFMTARILTYREEGNYEITFSGTDKAGNKTKEQKIHFSIDSKAPEISRLTYSDVNGLLQAKYGMIFSNQAILAEFDVWDSVVGVDETRVYVTIGRPEEKTEKTPIYIAHKSIGNRYYVYIPTDLKVAEFDDVITIWANDLLGNESHIVSSNMIFYTDYPNICMQCDVDNEKWTNQNVTFHTTVCDEKSGLKEVVYRIDGKEVKKVTFDKFITSYEYDLTATKSCDKVSGYKVSVEVTNNCGTTNTVSKSVFIDKEKPKVTLSGIRNGQHYSENQTIVTDVYDVSYSNTKTVYMVSRTLDGKTYNMPIAVFYSKKYDDRCKRNMTKEGLYKIYAVTTDSAGNKTISNVLSFVIDKTAPKLAVSGTTEGSMNGTPVALDFTCEESFFATNEVSVQAVRKLDGNTVTEQLKGFPKNAKHTAMSHTFSEDGTYEVTISAVDKAGNEAASKRITFSIDRSKPEIHISGTDNYEQWDKPVTLTVTVNESYYSGSSVEITGTKRDIAGIVTEINIPHFAFTGKNSSLTQLFEEDGIYELEVVSKDEAGNRESSKIHFTIDQTAPEINKVKGLDGGYYQDFKLADSMEEIFKDLTVISYHLLLNGVEYNGTDIVDGEGKYNLYVDAIDELGHTSSESIEFIIDHTAPKVIFTGVKDGESVRESGMVILSLVNSEDEITAVRMNGVDYGAETRSLSFEEYGSYRIEVDCIDKAGNSVTRSLYFVYHNPVLIILLCSVIGLFIIGICIWIINRNKRKETEE